MGMFADHFDFSVPLLWTVPRVLSPEECAALLQQHAQAEWMAATINAASGRVVDAQVRNNTTALVRDPDLGERLYQRLRPHVPPAMTEVAGGRRRRVKPAGLYLPLRIYRYEPGQRFGLHQDQSYQDSQGRRSLLTVLVYLNEGFIGGQTIFPEQDQIIAPQTGTALLFQHMLLHAGEEVQQGSKYLLRTDVLFEADSAETR